MTGAAGVAFTPAVRSWRLLEKLGEGTLSEVWRAHQDPPGRDVAVKLLKASVAPGSQLGVRFEREAALLASMAHQNIPQVYDAGITPEGRPFMVMELVDGLPLSALMKRSPNETIACEVATVIALKIARALEYVHLRGVIHRDTKPSNVLISRRGEVKLADFGLAREVSDTADGLGVVGTPAYMSPEQVLGDKLDFRSDIFSFGIVFYEMLTARKPFEEDPARTVMQKIRLNRYTPPDRVNKNVPSVLSRILGRCLEKNPSHRYPSTGALCDDLNEYLASAGVSSHEAKLITFLREIQFINDDEVSRALGPTAAQWAKSAARVRPMRDVYAGQGAALLVLLAGLGASELSLVRHPNTTPPLGPRPMGTANNGYLRVLARPWAEIVVDGVLVDTTPTARPIPLAPGSHFVRLRNPTRVTEDRNIQVAAGTVVWIDVDLHTAPGGIREE
jgi:eukaryotic-like serine/threonine-protein kinase